MHVVIFEGSRWDSFAPLTISRPGFMLWCGATTLLEKQIRYLNPDRLTLWVRPEFETFCREQVIPRLKVPTKVNEPLDDEPALIIPGRSLHFSRYEIPSEFCVAVEGEKMILQAYAKVPGLTPQDVMDRTDKFNAMLELPRTMSQSRTPDYVWDLISWNEEALVSDSLGMRNTGTIAAGPYDLIDEDNIFLGSEVQLAPGVVLNAARGPIMIARGSRIGANSVLEGPCYIGEYSVLAPLTFIGPGTTLGPGCNVGGAVHNSIMLGFTDKPNEGYLGDSYVGRWVNFGAGTTTANTKTTYGEINIHIGSRSIPSARRTMGSVIGDHCKTSINTRLSPGCYVGYYCFLAGAGLVPGFVPSFSFWTDEGMKQVEFEKGIEIAGRVMNRRDRRWTQTDTDIHRYAAEAAKHAER
jgi:UDP-N-acetylglucosamine diphosphorylase/glucosamine-1-phosphate N-acetyltransferase